MLGYLILAAFIAAAVAYVAYPPFREKVRGWKTTGTAVLVAALGFLQTVDLTNIFSDPKTAGMVVIGIGVVMAILRAVTVPKA